LITGTLLLSVTEGEKITDLVSQERGVGGELVRKEKKKGRIQKNESVD